MIASGEAWSRASADILPVHQHPRHPYPIGPDSKYQLGVRAVIHSASQSETPLPIPE